VTVPTVHAEWALSRLTARHREHRSAPVQQTRTGRHCSAVLVTRDANAVVDLVAIAESFAVARWSTVSAAPAGKSWQDRRRQWLQHGVDFNACPTWHELDGYIAARNAVQHNLGKLTDLQLGKLKPSVLAALAAAGIERNGDAVLLRAVDVDRCAQTCQQYIHWLDVAAPLPTK
jgi:hypothetical protein